MSDVRRMGTIYVDMMNCTLVESLHGMCYIYVDMMHGTLVESLHGMCYIYVDMMNCTLDKPQYVGCAKYMFFNIDILWMFSYIMFVN